MAEEVMLAFEDYIEGKEQFKVSFFLECANIAPYFYRRGENTVYMRANVLANKRPGYTPPPNTLRHSLLNL
jgi:hypothetical protein